MKEARAALAALAHRDRLAVFRLLVKTGPKGLAAGSIARTFAIPPSTLSFHLSHLSRAGLITAQRRQRSILYALDIAGFRSLLRFLTEDCCGARPEICRGILPSGRSRKTRHDA